MFKIKNAINQYILVEFYKKLIWILIKQYVLQVHIFEKLS